MGTWQSGDWEGNCPHGIWLLNGQKHTCRECAENFNCITGTYPTKKGNQPKSGPITEIQGNAKEYSKETISVNIPAISIKDPDQYELPLVFS